MRADLVFSYWIYVWYLLYAFNMTSYSPKFPLLLGLLDNLVMFYLMVRYGTSRRTLLYFILINTLIKVVPLYLLRNETIRGKDIGFTVVLFVLFIIWLHINAQTLTGNLKLIYESLLYGKNQTPFMSLLVQFKKNFKTLEIL